MYIFKLLLLFYTMDIILFYNFNSLIWLTGIVEVTSTCSRQPKLITCSRNDNNNYNVPFLHVFNWKSNKLRSLNKSTFSQTIEPCFQQGSAESSPEINRSA